MAKIILVSIALIFIISFLLFNLYAQQELSRQQLIALAMAKAYELGYNRENVSIIYDDSNEKWQSYLNYLGVLPKEYSLLLQRNYQSIYVVFRYDESRQPLFWIFIDRDNGEVITIIRDVRSDLKK
ncbi:MAG: hypothetical protein KBB01_02235 [Candidatus Omnitrophica bacterium]|jgi:hypothetical protein|nr:hypothetical protein [Candidatus Omnitrophota bacterium]